MKIKLVSIIFVILIFVPFFVSAQKFSKKAFVNFDCDNGWEFSDEYVSVKYYLDNYTDGSMLLTEPRLYFIIENKSSDFIYLDLGKCFIIRNGNPEPLWTDTKTYNTKGSSTNGSVNVGTIANVLGVGGVVGDLANGISIGGGKNNSKTVETSSPRVEPLPPMSKKEIRIRLANENFNSDRVYIKYECLFGCKMNLPNGESIEFKKEDSPIVFSTLINYSLTESCDSSKNVVNNFYANKFLGLYSNKGGLTSDEKVFNNNDDNQLIGELIKSHKEKYIFVELKKKR